MMRWTTIVGAGWLALYGGMLAFGVTPSRHAREEIPASVRASPGGYRSWSFWHSGSHGGK